MGGHANHAQVDDELGYTEPARAAGPGRLAYWEDRIDPEHKLAPAERKRRAEHAKKEHYTRMALKSARARAAKKAAG
jgi:hypothetical protein